MNPYSPTHINQLLATLYHPAKPQNVAENVAPSRTGGAVQVTTGYIPVYAVLSGLDGVVKV